ncbi:alpha/beta hydrolase [Amycolatopsis nigrescens]|uniref:alpha/beta hydrolase n=1 Tax=Amycolatopsis nigrescens TaxID=381445 RepID=UPI00036FD6B1|nr:alpha/beta hydrolase family protein [Amycolatopsis nigrescens]
MTGLVLLDEQENDGVRELKLFSPAVGREVTTMLLTPKGWQPGGHAAHPVLYFLHGSSDDERSLLAGTDLARLAAESGILVVLPNAGRMGFYTDWKVPDREGTVPQWETFHLVELLSLLEREYGASDVRMAAGVSMGGYGALRYGMRHPGMFRAVASLSGMMHLTRPGTAALFGVLSVREGMRAGRVWGPRRYCWDNWAANDPCVQAAALAGTRVYLAAGDGKRLPGDEFVAGMGLIERYTRSMTEDLETALRAAGVDVTANYSPGTHFWPSFRRKVDEFWPWAVETLT